MWKLKILFQFVLAALPGGERVNVWLQYLAGSHSPKNLGDLMVQGFQRVKVLDQYVDIEGSTVLEIGTGWDAINPLVFYVMGAKTCFTYDHVPHVRYSLVRRIINQMEERFDEVQAASSLPASVLQNRISKIKAAVTLRELFDVAGIVYRAPGDATATDLPDSSIDIVYSYAVLEHVSEKVLNGITTESKRVLRTGGVAYHGIGLHDHYVRFSKTISRVNFLKYPEWLWAFWVKNKISYTNRLREQHFIDIFQQCGAQIVWKQNKVDLDDIEVVRTMNIDKRFHDLTPEELAVYYSEMILTF